MSKSKKNVVDPEEIIKSFGADTARLFMLSDSPPDRDLEWTEAGVEGSFRFINKIFKLTINPPLKPKHKLNRNEIKDLSPENLELLRTSHRSVQIIGDNIKRFSFNKCVAQLHIFVNAITSFTHEGEVGERVKHHVLELLAQALAPFTPHIAEELWSNLGNSEFVSSSPWPDIFEDLLIDDTVEIAIQINGKVRAKLKLPLDLPKEEAEAAALSCEEVKKYMSGKEIKRIIVVPNRIINVVG